MTWEQDPIVAARGWESDPLLQPARPSLVLGGDLPVPAWLDDATGPNASGFFRPRREFSVGDEAGYRQVDFDNGTPVRTYLWRVTRVDEEGDRIEINDARVVLDTRGNVLSSSDPKEGTTARLFIPVELFVGKKWTAAFRNVIGQVVRNVSFDFRITARERIEVPAGRFNAFRLEGRGSSSAPSFALPSSMYDPVIFEETLWLAPSINFPVRRDRRSWPAMSSMARIGRNERHELVSLIQRVVSRSS